MHLREYQTTALQQLNLQLQNQNKAPLLVLPTGAGKTVIFSELARDFVDKGKKVMILVHRRELIKQSCQKLDLIGAKYGIIASDFPRDNSQPLQVASVYSLYRNIEKEKFVPDIIIFDEAHHIAASTWLKIVKRFKDATKVGVTATPIRLDNKPLGKFFNVLISDVQTSDLVAKGYLCNHKVFAGAKQPDLTGCRLKRGEYQKKDLKKVMDQPMIIGDAVEQYKKHLLDKPAIAFCVDIAHAKKVHEKFIKEGVKAELLTGEMKLLERDKVLNKLRNHEISVVVSIDIISEGTDLPCVTGAILLRPTNSLALYVQQVGRILRPEEGKTAIVLDHVGNTYRHDFVDVERIWELDFDEEKVKNKAKPIFKTCKQCNYVYKPQKVCPNCGHELTKEELLEVEGQLEELKRSHDRKPETIKEKYKESRYVKSKYHNINLLDFEYLTKNKKIVFKTKTNWNTSFYLNHNQDKQVQIGDNIIYYVGLNQQKYGIVVGFIDKGTEDTYIHPYTVPAINKDTQEYLFPDYIQKGKELGELQDIRENKHFDKIIFLGKRTQPYIHIRNKETGDIMNLYLRRLRKKVDRIHAGYTCIILTDNGLETYETADKTGWMSTNSINFKQGEKVRKRMRGFKFDRRLMDNLIDVCRKAHFNVGYKIDWIHRNYYARKLSKELQRIYK